MTGALGTGHQGSRALQVEVRVKGRIDADWPHWFGGLAIMNTQGHETILSGIVADQAALYGVLARLQDLGLSLLSVKSVEGNSPAVDENPGF